MADLARFLVGRAGVILASEIRLEHFAHILADAQWRKRLKIWMAFEEDDALDQPVGVLHLFDRLLTLLLGKLGVTPIFQKAVMKPVLVNSTELQKERVVKPLDDLYIAFH